MKPVRFDGHNIVMGEGQPKYLELPAYREPNGIIHSCWELSPEEIEQITSTGKIWLTQCTFNSPMQPILLRTSKPEILTTKQN